MGLWQSLSTNDHQLLIQLYLEHERAEAERQRAEAERQRAEADKMDVESPVSLCRDCGLLGLSGSDSNSGSSQSGRVPSVLEVRRGRKLSLPGADPGTP